MSFSLTKNAVSRLNIYLGISRVSSTCTVDSQTAFTSFISVVSRTLADDVSSKKKSAKLSASENKMKEFPVETDPYRLVEYCCGSNIYKEGEDVKLKPESEYPDWLWTLHIGEPPKLEDLDPNSKDYWLYVRRLACIKGLRRTALKLKLMKCQENLLLAKRK